jgi:rhodanese-related sulfurtransferase/uncharacterized membrane protein YedE/YeeE
MIADGLPAIATALPIGIAFGVILERTGLGDPRVIAGQLTGRDFTVVRVMFGAIVTAMLGLVWASAAGWIDLSTIAVPPTDVAAQVIGSVIFGGGFALAALCPGTACVAASSGRRDGLAAVAGMLGGTALTALVWPAFGDVAAAVPREAALLPDDLGLPLWAVVLIVTGLAVGAAIIGRRLDPRRPGSPWRLSTGEIIAVTLAVAFAAVDGRVGLARGSLAEIAGEIEREADHVEALELAEWVRAGIPGLRIVDVRDHLASEDYGIPGAEALKLHDLASTAFGPAERVVLYSEGGAHAAQAWVLLRARGVSNVLVLKDGLAAWEDEVLSPVRPAAGSDSALARYHRARELSLWFGGMPRAVPVPDDGSAIDRSRRRRNTC